MLVTEFALCLKFLEYSPRMSAQGASVTPLHTGTLGNEVTLMGYTLLTEAYSEKGGGKKNRVLEAGYFKQVSWLKWQQWPQIPHGAVPR